MATANPCFGHMMLMHTAMAVDPTEQEHRLCLFLLCREVVSGRLLL